MSTENINKFNNCMDQGDKRVQELFVIAKKVRNGDLLSSDEDYKYLRVKKELVGTIVTTDIIDLPIDELAGFQQQG